MIRRGAWRGSMLMVGCWLSVAGSAWAGGDHTMPAKPGSPAFERMKQLAGTWTGTTTMEGKAEPASIEYRTTSGGTAVIETLFSGTPHEMVSVYHDEAGQLAMTHYCVMGNQPKLRLTNAADGRMDFSLAEGSGIDAAHESHMHALTLTWTDADHLTQAWTSYENGKANETTTINVARSH